MKLTRLAPFVLAALACTISLAVSAQGQTVTYLAQFNGTNGSLPYGALIQATDGNYYGAAHSGTYPYDEIFRVTPTGEISSVYSFCSLSDCTDGQYTIAPILGSDGNLYGVSLVDGKGGAYGWSGALYRLTLDGQLTTQYTFCPRANCVQLEIPNGIIQGSDGNFYGTTYEGGANQAPARGSLTLAIDGNLYGIAVNDDFDAGGGYGIAYEVTPGGGFTSLATFYNNPNGQLLQGTDGSFYGTTPATTYESGDGTVFRLSNGLSPFVKTVPMAAKVGKQVILLGNNLMGSSSVTFNGVPASFTVASDTYIKATVPSGATTGAVSVVTPSGTLNSNPQFVVTK